MNTALLRRFGRRSVLSVLLLALLTAGLASVGARSAHATIGANDYPSNLANVAKDAVVDPWHFYNRECTSFVAWRLNNDNGVSFQDTMTQNGHTATWGDASNWATAAATLGYTVDSNPAPGAVAVWPSSVGHVGYVDSVNTDGTINTEEYNWFTTQYPSGDGAYHTRTEFNWSAVGVQFIHVKDLTPTAQPSPTYEYHVFDGDSSGAIHETYWGGGHSLTTYQVANVGSPITSSVFAATSNGLYHVFSGTSAGTIYETYWTPGSGSVTTYQLGSTGSQNPITSIQFAVTSNGLYHVFSGSSSGAIYETYWTPGSGGVTTYQLANVGSSNPIASIQFTVTSNGVYHVFDGDTSGAIHETYWGGGNSLTTYQLANLGSWNPIASIVFTVTSNGVYHVFSGSTSGSIQETYWAGGNSLTTYQVANVGAQVASISFQVTPDGVYHVFDGDTNGLIHETYWGSGNALTSYQLANVGSSNPIASAQFAVTS